MPKWQTGVMPVPIVDLLREPRLGLVAHTTSPSDRAVRWAHSSDLEDPTPFLQGGELLLTTGRQFVDMDSARVEAYVKRLVSSDVAALGFGEGVLHPQVPGELVRACVRHQLTLIVVPYLTPFLAISQHVAAVEASHARSRVDWALSTQNAVSVAALGDRGVDGAITRAAQLLQASIVLVFPDEETRTFGGPVTASDLLGERASHLFRSNRRARVTDQFDDRQVIFQTLGASGRLRAVLACVRTRPFDDADIAVVTTLTALAEVSLEHSQDLATGLRDLAQQLFELLENGQVETVRQAVRNIPLDLPRENFVVVRLLSTEVSPRARNTLERQGFGGRKGLFVVERGEEILVLSSRKAWTWLRRFLEGNRIRAGVSERVGWSRLGLALTQASRAHRGAGEGQIVEFSELIDNRLLGLISHKSAAEIAQTRLAEISPDVLHAAEVWFRHNCAWESAARDLGVHRHTLKAKLLDVAERLDVNLDSFEGRAELWSLITAAGHGAG